MTSQDFSLTGGSWHNDGYSLYKDEPGNGLPDSNGVYHWDMKKTGSHLNPGAGNSFFTFTPGTTTSNGVWYAGGPTTRNNGVISTGSPQFDTWNEADAFSGNIPTSGTVLLSTNQPSGSLSFDLPNSEITVTIDSDSPSSTSSDVYALSGPDGFLHQYSHTNGTTSTYTITSATSLAGSWIFGSTISGTYTTLDTLTIGGNPPTSSIRKVFCNFW
jgi:hypothetical protein